MHSQFYRIIVGCSNKDSQHIGHSWSDYTTIFSLVGCKDPYSDNFFRITCLMGRIFRGFLRIGFFRAILVNYKGSNSFEPQLYVFFLVYF